MIIYHASKKTFVTDVMMGSIADNIDNAFVAHLGRHTSPNEVNSWKNSMLHMQMVVNTHEIPDDAIVAIEYQIPLTSKRVDFIITGNDENQNENIVIIELKQWGSAELTEKDALVRTQFQAGMQEVSHPSYQAWSYAFMLENYNESIRENNIKLTPCAFLHNYDKSNRSITDSRYQEYIDLAPVFMKGDALALQDFIKKHIKYSSKKDIVWFIENGRLRPSKQLADSIGAMLRNNREFVLLDEQKVVYETALTLARKAQKGRKQVYIVEGGPGTGKSVLAIQLLAELTKEGLVTQYVSKNSAPRDVYARKLKGDFSAADIKNLFVGSGCFVNESPDLHDALIVDEAHRLNEKSGLFYAGENQVLEIIRSAKFSIFFVDDLQRVHIKDIGKKEYIASKASSLDAEIHYDILQSQFRCNGSDGYPSWLENALQIRPTANIKLTQEDFDFQIFEDPNVLFDTIRHKNKINNKSRLVAGYCWNWISKKNKNDYDIVFPEFNFKKQWNLFDDSLPWIMGDESIDQIGCIHTCQGLELDYVGVIIGNDMRYEGNRVVTDVTQRASTDRSVFGYKQMMKDNPEKAAHEFDEIIKNTYRTLMTRGMKGCYVYFCDKNLEKHFKDLLDNSETEVTKGPRVEANVNDEVRYIDYLPLYSIGDACHKFVDGQNVKEEGWIRVEGELNRTMFVIKAEGNGLAPDIKDGDFCQFRLNPSLIQNTYVLTNHPGHYDPDYKGENSIKQVHWNHYIDHDGEGLLEIVLQDKTGKNCLHINSESECCRNFAEFIKVI